MIHLYRPYHWLTACVIGCFLIAATVPRFGTVGHRHEAGRTPHVHLHYVSPRAAHDHQNDRRHRQATHALPFGGAYAHSTSPHEHPSSRSGDAAQPRKAMWTPADFHWHFDNGALPPGVTVVVVLEPLWHGLYLTHARPLSIHSQTRFDIRPRGPPC